MGSARHMALSPGSPPDSFSETQTDQNTRRGRNLLKIKNSPKVLLETWSIPSVKVRSSLIVVTF